MAGTGEWNSDSEASENESEDAMTEKPMTLAEKLSFIAVGILAVAVILLILFGCEG